jgi:hypothetical protein
VSYDLANDTFAKNDASCEKKLTLKHGIHNETNSHGQHDHAIDLRSRIVVFFTRKGQNGNGCTSQNYRHVHPSQEGSEVKSPKRICMIRQYSLVRHN